MSEPIHVDYYSDLLCVWAWIAQPRLEELKNQWGEQVQVRHRFVDIFGDSHQKIPRQWGEEDGFEKFHQHVVTSAEPFEHCTINPAIWNRVRPRSSSQAHLVLKAVQLTQGKGPAEDLALQLRRAFFVQGQDISDLDLLLQLAASSDNERDELTGSLRDGSAMASLSTDLRSAAELGVRGSPTWVLNDGRQLLYGNVGYRILSANIEELLRYPADEASWC